MMIKTRTKGLWIATAIAAIFALCCAVGCSPVAPPDNGDKPTPPPAVTYTVTVTGGVADKTEAAAGDTVTLTLGEVAANKEFSHWTINGTAIEGNSFTMPAANVEATAVLTDKRYTITVAGGSADKAKAAAGDTVTLTPGAPDPGYKFESWTVSAGTLDGNKLTMPAGNVTVTAVFSKIDYTVTVTGGSADKTTANIGDTVTLTPDEVATGKEFSHWTVNGAAIEGNSFVMPADNAVVEAVITNTRYAITVTGGTADVKRAEGGATVTLTPGTPEPGYEFKSWKVDGEAIEGNTFTMPTADVEAEAVFGKIDYTITVTGGSADNTTANIGDEITLTPEPQDGYEFKSWNVISGGVTVTDNKFTVGVENVVIEAVYGKIDYAVEVYGAEASKETANVGDEITLTTFPAEPGYEFKSWNVVAGGVTITDNKFVMPACDVEIEAVFGKIQYTVTVTGGTADKTAAGIGDEVVLTPDSPEVGYEFKSWTVSAGTLNGNTLSMPTENVTITAVFGKIDYTVTVTGGTADMSTANIGDEVTLTATPQPGYEFKSWNVISGGVTVADNKFTVGSENVSIEAVYDKIEYTVTVTGGTADLTVATVGDTVTLTVGAVEEGKEFYYWSVNDQKADGNTFAMPAANAEVKAVLATVKKIQTSVQPASFMYREAKGTVATERNGTAFGATGAKADWTMQYVKYYIYDSVDATDALGYLIVDCNGVNAANNGSYKSSDGKYSIVRHGPPNTGWGNTGGAEFFNLLKYELGVEYCAGKTYYFGIQAVAKENHYVKEGDEWVKYIDSDISAKCTYAADDPAKKPIVEDTTKPNHKLTLTIENGTVNGALTTIDAGYGSTVTLIAEASATQLFAGWQVAGRTLSYKYEYKYTVDVTENSTITAVYVNEDSDLVTYVQTPAASDAHIRKSAGGSIEFDRMNGGTGTFFVISGLDYVKYYVYESSEAGSEPIGAFKFYMAPVPNGTKVAIIESLDGVISYQIVEGNGGATPGNFYIATDVDKFFNLLKYELGGRYADGKTYYFAVQGCTNNERTILRDGSVTAIAGNGFSKNSSTVVECNVTIESAASGVEPVVVKAYAGSNIILQTEVPDGKLVKWYKVMGEAQEYLGYGNGLRVPVTADTVFRYEISDAVVSKKLAAPDNTDNAMIIFKGATIEYDRQKNEDGSRKTAFVEGVDYIIFHVYTDEAKTNHVGQFKLVRKSDGNFYLSACEGYGAFSDWQMTGNEPGDLYTIDGNAHNRIKEAIRGYNNNTVYYYACQAVSETPEYESSEIGAVGGGWQNI